MNINLTTKTININPLIFFITLIHFGITTLWDPFVFTSPSYALNYKYILLKMVSFVILFVSWNFILFIYKQNKKKNRIWQKKTRIFLIYFSIMMFLLLLTWPGIWKGDEYWIYQSAQNLEIHYWYHYLSNVYYIICLMILPFGAGILIIQLIIISLIITHILYDLSTKTSSYYWFYLLFLLPPIIFHNLYPLRAVLYAYFLLFCLYELYFKIIRRTSISIYSLIAIIILAPILSNWRSEGIIFLPIILLLLFIGLRNKLKIKKIILIFFIIIASSLLLKYPQKKWENNNMDYALTAMLNPLSNMLQYEHLNKFNEVQNDLSSLINLDILKDYADYKEIPAFHSKKEELFNQKNDANFSKFKKAYLKLVVNNPGIFLSVRLKTFLATTGFDHYPGWEWETGAFSLKKVNNGIIKNFTSSSFLNRDFGGNNRIHIIRLLEGKNPISITSPLPHLYIFWNLVIVLSLLIIWILITILRKDAKMFIIASSILIYFIIIFCTAPAIYFMYYFPVYLVTYIMSFSYLADINKNGWRKKIS